MADESETKTRNKTQKPPYTNSVSNRSNTTLSGNQGSPQPGAPRSHSVSRKGIKTHRIGTIQKLAMALPCSQWKGEKSETECETELWWKGDGRVSTTALRVLSDSAQTFFSKHHRHWELQSALVVHTAFKTVFNAIELAMIASSTALTQACKRGAPSPRTVGLIEMFGRGSGKAACVSSAKIFCRVWLHSCLHKLYLLINNCTFRCVSSGLDSDA